VSRPRHSKKDVEKALREAEETGCIVEQTSAGHKWGRVITPDGRAMSIWSTPRNPENHAKQIRRFIARQDK